MSGARQAIDCGRQCSPARKTLQMLHCCPLPLTDPIRGLDRRNHWVSPGLESVTTTTRTLPSQHILLCTCTRPHHDIHAGDSTVLARLHPHHSATLEPRHDPLRRGESLHTHRHEIPPAHIERIWPGLRLANSAEPEGTQLYLEPLNSLRHRQAPLQLLRGGLQSSGKFNKTRGQVMVFGPWDRGGLKLTQERTKVCE